MKLNSILVSVGLAMFVLGIGTAASAAQAKHETAQGTVESVSPQTDTLTLKDVQGHTMQFKASNKSQIKDLKPGEQVNVTYEKKGNENWIREISKAQKPGEKPQQQKEKQKQ